MKLKYSLLISEVASNKISCLLAGLSSSESSDSPSGNMQHTWLVLLSLHGILVRNLAGRQSQDRTALGFAVMSHERFLDVLALPSIDGVSDLDLDTLKVDHLQNLIYFTMQRNLCRDSNTFRIIAQVILNAGEPYSLL